MTEFLSETVAVIGLTGTFEMRIENYSQHTKAVGASINSKTFRLCGRSWSLVVFPGGSTDENNNCLAIFVYNEEKTDINVKYSISLVRWPVVTCVPTYQETKLFSRKGTFSENNKMDKNTKSSNWGQSFDQSVISPESPCIFNDTVIVRVDIKINNNTLVSKPVFRTGPSIVDSLGEILGSAAGADVTFVVGPNKHEITAHKFVLVARSPVFRAMFTHNMSESNTNQIVISDLSPEVVREMLHFIYTDKLQSETLGNTLYEGLLTAAIKYDVVGLACLCEAHFCGQISDSTVVDILKTASLCGSEHLEKQCLIFIKQNCARLLGQHECVSLVTDLMAAADSKNKAAKESSVGWCVVM